MTAREWLAVTGGLALMAAAAFSAGLWLGGDSSRPAAEAVPVTDPEGEDARLRDVYSPALLSDPWFVRRQRENIEALERHCRRTGQLCDEARQARRWGGR